MTRLAIAATAQSRDTITLMTVAARAKGLGESTALISPERKTPAAAPNTTRSPTNGDLVAIKLVITREATSPKTKIGSRPCGPSSPVERSDLADCGKAIYVQKTREHNDATRLRSSPGRADVISTPVYKLHMPLPPSPRHKRSRFPYTASRGRGGRSQTLVSLR